MRRVWLRWRALSVRERFVLLEALILMPAAGILLRLFRYQPLLSFLEKVTPLAERNPGISAYEARQMGKLVNIAAWRGAYKATCLRRSLVLWWMLRRRGSASQLRIGVRMENGEFTSHAWVERDGQVLNDAPDVGARYRVMI